MTQIDRYACAEVFERLNDYLDRELDESERELVKAHLEACAVCAAEFIFEGRVASEIRCKLSRIAAPSGLLEKVSRAIAGMEDDPGRR